MITRIMSVLILGALTVTGVLAQSSQSIENLARNAKAKNILLVHGAWADGSSYSKVIPILQEEGFNVVSVQIPLTSFADDVAATQRALALEDGPVLLVGHSYGGAVITEVGTDPKVTGLVYLAALAPSVGESTSSLLGSVPATLLFSQLTEDPYGFLKVTEPGYLADFVEGLPEAEKKLLWATQEPTNSLSLDGAATQAAWETKPSWYVVTLGDRAVSTELQFSMARRMNASIITIPSCHVVMLSHPEEVSAFITQAALGIRRD